MLPRMMSLQDRPGWIGTWSPAIGDPSVIGWLTVVVYLIAAALCFRVCRAIGNVENAKKERRAWALMTAAFGALAVNKQLDLQTALTESARILAKWQGWYGERRAVQVLFLAVVALGAIFRKTLPERHPMIANCLWNLGRELTASDAERGQGLVEEALAIRREVLPADHPDIALLLEYLGSMLVQRGELWRAESHYVEALEIRKVQTSVSDNDLVADYYSLAYIRLLRGKNADDELEQLEALLLEATDEQFRQRISKAIQKLRAMSAQAGAGSEP